MSASETLGVLLKELIDILSESAPGLKELIHLGILALLWCFVLLRLKKLLVRSKVLKRLAFLFAIKLKALLIYRGTDFLSDLINSAD